MQIVLSTLIHGRHETVKRCHKLNRDAGIKDWAVAYSEKSDKELAESMGAAVVSQNVIPLKAQKSLDLTQIIEKDAVLLMGSDDYVDAAFVDLITRALRYHDYISFANMYFEQDGEFYLWPGYLPISYRYGEPAGAGKVVREDLLDRMDYQVFDTTKARCTDLNSHARLMQYAESPIILDCVKEGVMLVDVKDGDSTTPLSKFQYLKKVNFAK